MGKLAKEKLTTLFEQGVNIAVTGSMSYQMSALSDLMSDSEKKEARVYFVEKAREIDLKLKEQFTENGVIQVLEGDIEVTKKLEEELNISRGIYIIHDLDCVEYAVEKEKQFILLILAGNGDKNSISEYKVEEG